MSQLTPTIARAILSPAHTKILMGPRGELKTTGAYQNWLYWASTITDPSALPYRVIQVRDTWTNLQKSEIQTLKEMAARGLAVEWKDSEHEAIAGNGLVQFLFFGMDTLKDLNKFQGLGAGGLCLNEPAPAAVNDIGVGLPIEAWAIGVTSLRQPGVPHKCVIPMNPPEEDHWTLQLPDLVRTLARQPAYRDLGLTVEVFRIPKGENPYITDADRLIWRAALEAAGRGDLVQRLSEGIPGFVVQGEVAFPEYSERQHVAPEPLEPIRNLPISLCLDFGLTPVCIFSQVTPLGHWRLFDAVAGEGMGLEELLEIHALPWLRRYLGELRDWRFRHIGGPEALVKEQGSGVEIYQTLSKVLGGAVAYEAGPIGWEERMRGGKRVLNRLVSGRPLVQVDPESTLLRRMFRGGAHFPKDSNGQVVRTKAAMARVCVDAETEMLTGQGWQRHDQLAKGQPVFAYALAAQKLVQTPLINVHRDDRQTECYRFEHSGLSMVITPDHRAVVRRRLSRRGQSALFFPPECVKASDLNSSHYVVRSGTYSRRLMLSDDLVRLCAWVMAEGSYCHPGQIRIVQSDRVNRSYVDSLNGLADRMGFGRGQPVRSLYGRQHQIVQWIVRGDLAALVRLLLPDKLVTSALWERLSANQFRLFLYEFARGDGTWNQHPGEWWAPEPPPPGFTRGLNDFFFRSAVTINQKSEAAINGLHVIATLAGIPGHVRYQHGRWLLSLSNHQHLSCVDALRRDSLTVPFVWCPETPHGTWIARRRGTVFVTGNSGIHDDLLDAFCHGAAVLFPVIESQAPPKREPVKRTVHSWQGR